MYGIAIVVPVLSLLIACTGEAERGAAARTGDALEEVLSWERDVTFEENDEVINVFLRARPDPAGGFLLADAREGFIRRYADDGRLLAQFGGAGHGPSEFPDLAIALRLPDGQIAAFDEAHKGAVFDSAGRQLVRTFRTPVGRLHAAMVLDDSTVLLGGRIPGDGADRRLHLWNVRADTLVASFFSPPLPSEAHRVAASVAGWVGFDRRGDTLAVVTSLSDTVYLMTARGNVLERIPIPSTHLRTLDPGVGLPTRRDDIGEARRWMGSFSLIADVHWAGNSFIVQYQDRTRPEADWRLIGIRRSGTRIFEAIDTPPLFFADPATGFLYLQSPESPTPNVWRIARLKDGAP